jgi:hypothetical protein
MSSPAKKFIETFLADDLDYGAAANRLEVIIDLMTDRDARMVAQTIKVDRAAAARAIDYLRRCSAGAEPDGDEEALIWDFLGAHNLSMPWVMTGDPTSMITTLAEGTNSQRPPQLRVVS